MPRRAHAFTLVELLVVITIIGILMAIILPSLSSSQRSARELQERKQLGDVNTAWKAWAASHNNAYPIPGLVRRQRFDVNGNGVDDSDPFVMGSGREASQWNDHAGVLSVCIMENLLAPEQLVSPNEHSDTVFAYTSYDYSVLGAPDGDDTERWDRGFANDLLGEDVGFCHNSYAIMPLAGERRRDQWDRPGDSSFAVIATRGPLEGDSTLLNELVDDEGNVTRPASNTAYLMAKPGGWRGILVYADGHTDIATGFYPQGSTYRTIDPADGSRMDLPDNIFKAEEAGANESLWQSSRWELLGRDILLTHTHFDGNSGGDSWIAESSLNPLDITFTPLHD